MRAVFTIILAGHGFAIFEHNRAQSIIQKGRKNISSLSPIFDSSSVILIAKHNVSRELK
jgi:hypothetical protein